MNLNYFNNARCDISTLEHENARLKRKLTSVLHFYSRAFYTGLRFNRICFRNINEIIRMRDQMGKGNTADGALIIIRLFDLEQFDQKRSHYLMLLYRIVRLIQHAVHTELFQSDHINEFVLFLDEVKTAEQARITCKEIQQAVSLALSQHDKAGVMHRLFFAVALLTQNVRATEGLVRQALCALSEAIEKQRSIVIYDESIGKYHERQRMIEHALREEIDKRDPNFSFRLQPIMNYRSHLYGAELLIRWRHPVLGDISPAEFIPIVERIGLSVMLDQWVLRKSIHHYKFLRSQLSHKLFLFINISPDSLMQNDFAAQVSKAFGANHYLCKYFNFEITERVSLHDINIIKNNLMQIVDLGMRVALDDFGSGFCAFSNILELPISIIKIDRVLSQSISTDKRRQALLKTLLTMRTNAGIKILIEGVEHLEQIAYIQKFSYDFCQGYFYAKPLTIDEFISFAQDVVVSTDYYYNLLFYSP